MPLSQEERFDMNEQASYFINKPLHSHREIFDIDIPNYISIGEIIGRRGSHINEVKSRFNAIINIKKKYKNNVYLPGNVIKIINNEQNLDEINQYYEEFFDRFILRTS